MHALKEARLDSFYVDERRTSLVFPLKEQVKFLAKLVPRYGSDIVNHIRLVKIDDYETLFDFAPIFGPMLTLL